MVASYKCDLAVISRLGQGVRELYLGLVNIDSCIDEVSSAEN